MEGIEAVVDQVEDDGAAGLAEAARRLVGDEELAQVALIAEVGAGRPAADRHHRAVGEPLTQLREHLWHQSSSLPCRATDRARGAFDPGCPVGHDVAVAALPSFELRPGGERTSPRRLLSVLMR